MSPLLLLVDRGRTLLRRLAADRAGFSAILTAMMMTILLGFVGLAVDVGFWQWIQRDMQEAADHAAFAAAQSEVALNPSAASSESGIATSTEMALAVAVNGLGLNGTSFAQSSSTASSTCFTSATNNNLQICMINKAATGVYNNNAWEVTISQPRPMWFSRILFSSAGDISASAVAAPLASSGLACALALAPSGAGMLLVDGGGGAASVTFSNCDAVVKSSDQNALESTGSSTVAVQDVYVDGGENNGGLTFTPGPGSSQNHDNINDQISNFFSNPYTLRGLLAPALPGPTAGKLGNGCDYYTGDYPSGATTDLIHVNLPPNGTAQGQLSLYDGPGIYCDNPSNPNPASPIAFMPPDNTMLPPGEYVLYGVGMQLPGSSATMSYTCPGAGETYASSTGTCNNIQGKPTSDTPTASCNGGGVNATGGVTIYLKPRTVGATTYNTGAVALSPASGTACFAIAAPQATQMQNWTSGTNYSTAYAANFHANGIEGLAIWVGSTMSANPTDTIGPNASVALNGAFYDQNRTVQLTNSNTSGTCSQIVANQIVVTGPATVNLAYCSYPNQTYLQSPAYSYLGPVQLVQ